MEGPSCISSVVQRWPSTSEVLGSTPSTRESGIRHLSTVSQILPVPLISGHVTLPADRVFSPLAGTLVPNISIFCISWLQQPETPSIKEFSVPS